MCSEQEKPPLHGHDESSQKQRRGQQEGIGYQDYFFLREQHDTQENSEVNTTPQTKGYQGLAE